MSRISPKIAISIGVLVVAFTALVGLSLQGSMVYYLTVSEYLDHPPSSWDRHFRVNGRVQPGSIQKQPGVLGARFVMTDGQRTLPVVYRKEVPDTFLDDSEVVVEGGMRDGTFEAQTLFAKCPSKYESEQKGGYAPTP
jgi:cytochrome c-type biogenesis protein CcmE